MNTKQTLKGILLKMQTNRYNLLPFLLNKKKRGGKGGNNIIYLFVLKHKKLKGSMRKIQKIMEGVV